jgi:hypothetical protein
MAEGDVSEAVAWLESVGLIRRTGETAHGQPVFVPVALSPEDRACVYAKLAERLRRRGVPADEAAAPQRPDLPPRRS